VAAIDALSGDQFRQHVANVNNFYEAAPASVARAGRAWYPTVHGMVEHEVKGTSWDHAAGSGIVAATSPGVDWNSTNKNVLGAAKKLKTADFDALKRGDRSPIKGTEIARSPTSNILKAQRIMDGENPDDVLTGFKTNSFFHNIHNPADPNPVTVDGRAFDINNNAMTGWTKSRGISGKGKPAKARYEAAAEPYRAVAAMQTEKQGRTVVPNEVQAVTWEHGKHVEMSTPLKSGGVRKKGPTRVGQPYQAPQTPGPQFG
jgi:hypothetical protein